ncbi:SIR2 family protein [Enterovibrio baiacu]|uniref:SIR2 family protein n=1 Tax=Enterovibrio baiacu TaxID=2491023 RepID=UPI003D0B4464
MPTEFKPQKHLINILKNTSDHNPNFTIFLGAGASVTSNIEPAKTLIEKWRCTYKELYENEEKQETALENQYWYNKATEYSILFELLYDHPSQRRVFIESCIEKGKPSWGYIYLVNLFKNKHFNTIFTTNFDDLINEACYTFSSNLKPIVCAHDSSINSVRLTSDRPKIIKLHGDFLFDNIKNTVRELESLEGNMRSKFKQYASEFGMIVIGYAGNDRSIMDTLNTLLHTGENFPQGIYWCVRKGTNFDSLSEPLKALSRFPKFNLVEIDGFDEFMAEIHNELGCNLQKEVSDPYNALAQKLNNIFSEDHNFKDDTDKSDGQKIIKNDYNLLMREIARTGEATKFHQEIIESFKSIGEENFKKFRDSVTDPTIDNDELFKDIANFLNVIKESNGRPIMPVPYSLLARKYNDDGDFQDAIEYAIKDISESKRLTALEVAINAMVASGDYSKIEELVLTCKKISIEYPESYALLDASVELMQNKEYEYSRILLENFKETSPQSRDSSYYILNSVLLDILEESEVSTRMKEKLVDCLGEAVDNGEDWMSLGFAIICDHLALIENASVVIDDTNIRILKDFLKREEMPIHALLSDKLSDRIRSRIDGESLSKEKVVLLEQPDPAKHSKGD